MIGERIRAIRQARRFSIRELERRTGVSNSYLSQIERGCANEDACSIGMLKSIARGLGVSLDVLVIEPSARPEIDASRPDDI